MGITIDEAVLELRWLKKVNQEILETDVKELDVDSAWIKHWECVTQALDIAIDTARKYQMYQLDYEARLKDDMVAMRDKPSGKWINIKDGRGGHLKGHECSFCHSYPPLYRNGGEYLSRYCPECGMRMESEVDNGNNNQHN